MALQGFVESDYLAAKLAALQADSATKADWTGKTTAQLKTFLANVGFTPESHYQAYGWAEGLAPNALFNAAQYKLAKATDMFNEGLEEGGTAYATVAEAQAAFEAAWPYDPYLHYVQYGSAEGINPSNDFDESEYLASKLADLKADSETATEWADKTVDDVKAAFAAAGLSALGHYQAYGEDEGIAVTAVPAEEQVDTDDAEAVEGETFSLTNSGVTGSYDNLNGTADNDTFIAGPGTAETGDVLDGKGGTDALKIQEDTTAPLTMAPTMSNIEQVWLNNAANNNVTVTFSGANATGIEEVWADRVADTGGGTNDDVVFNNISKSVQLGVFSGPSTAANRTNVTFTLNDVTGSADEASLVLDKASVNDVTIAGVETLNVKTQGGASKIDGTLTAAAATKLVLTGDQNATIDAIDVSNVTSEIDASAMTGNLTLILEDNVGKEIFKGGKGDDALYTAGTNFAAGDSFDGGEGTNAIGIAATGAITATTGKLIKNFQIFDAAAASGTGYDMSLIKGDGSSSTITGLQVSAALGGNTTIKNLADGADVTIKATTGANLTVVQQGAADAGSNDDVLNFKLAGSANITATNLVAADIETINITSGAATATTGHTITASTFAAANKISFTGDEQLTVTALTADAAASIDASAMTDKFIMGAAFGGGGIQLVQGGTAADTLISNNVAGSTIQGNGGADTITLGGAGNAEIVKYAAQSDSTGTKYDEITNFTTAEDDIDLAAFGFTGAAAQVFTTTKATVANATDTFTIAAADAAGFFENAGADRGVAFATDATDGVVFVDVDKDGDWDAAQDMAIYLQGQNTFVTGDVVFA